jgi:hypothetical protein
MLSQDCIVVMIIVITVKRVLVALKIVVHVPIVAMVRVIMEKLVLHVLLIAGNVRLIFRTV